MQKTLVIYQSLLTVVRGVAIPIIAAAVRVSTASIAAAARISTAIATTVLLVDSQASLGATAAAAAAAACLVLGRLRLVRRLPRLAIVPTTAHELHKFDQWRRICAVDCICTFIDV